MKRRVLDSDSRPASHPPPAFLLCFGGLAVLVVFCTAFYAWRIGLPLQINRNEPWNAWHTLRWLGGLPLYPERGDLIVNNYPPLSFIVIGEMARIGGDPLIIGRVLSLLSLFAIGFAVAGCVRNFGGSRLAAIFGAVWFVASIETASSGYTAMNDPHLPALAMMSLACWMFLHADRVDRSSVPSLALMVLAGFYKHNLFAIPATVLIWAWITRGRRALWPTVAAAGLAAAGLSLCLWIYGTPFVDQLLMPRVVSFARAFTGWEFLPWVGLVLGAAWSISAREERAGCFVGLFMALAFVLFALQKMGQGVARNAQFELQFAVAIGVGLASDRLVAIALRSKRGARIATIVFLAVLAREVALFLTLPIPRTILPDFREELLERAAVANSEVERIRGMPGLFACSQMITCFQAGKPFLYDSFAMGQRVLTGAWTQARLNAEIAARKVRFEKVDPLVVW